MVFEKNIEKINPIKRDQVVSCIRIAQRSPKVVKMIIFGSSVREDCSPASDVDICLVINGTTKCMEMYELARDINYACDYNCDILKYHKLNDKFKKEIESKGVVVYELKSNMT